MGPTNVIAIFDIGKTNKKFFLLDEQYAIVQVQSAPFREIKDEDGDDCEDVVLLTNWILDTLRKALNQKQFVVKAVNFSAYGASFVYVDEEGNAIAPLYNYLKKYPEVLKESLYEKYGGAEKISCETASPVLGSLNSGMQLYRISQQQKELYARMHYALHLPQYASFLISRQAYSDITSVGCHTQLWDFNLQQYHEWVLKEGLDKKLAPIIASDKTVTSNFEGQSLKIGAGLHDSSAALIPYLAVFKEPFILLSTGTWCISLNPFNKTTLTPDELKQDCLCYMEYQGKPVKASRLFAGYDHEQQVKRLAEHFDKPIDYYKSVKYDASILDALQNDVHFAIPKENKSISLEASVFCTRQLEIFETYEQAYHGLIYDLVQQQQYSTQLVVTGGEVTRIFVDGGFSNNTIYMNLLAKAFPAIEVYAASVAQATAMGAALAIHREWNQSPVPADMVKLKYYQVPGELNPAS